MSLSSKDIHTIVIILFASLSVAFIEATPFVRRYLQRTTVS